MTSPALPEKWPLTAEISAAVSVVFMEPRIKALILGANLYGVVPMTDINSSFCALSLLTTKNE